MKKKLLFFSIAFLGLTFLQAQDTIRLSSGKVIVANIRRDTKKNINLELEEGTITFSKDQISSIHKRKDWPWHNALSFGLFLAFNISGAQSYVNNRPEVTGTRVGSRCPPFFVDVNYMICPRIAIGLIAGFSNFTDLYYTTTDKGSDFFDANSKSVSVYFHYDPPGKFERINIIAGLLLHKFSRQHKSRRFASSNALPGMLVGLEYSVHESRISYLRIAGQYRISKAEAIPPNLSNIFTKIPSSHFSLGVVYGFKFDLT